MSPATLEKPPGKLTQPNMYSRNSSQAIARSTRGASQPILKPAHLIDLEPKMTSYSITGLRSQLGLAPILQEKKIRKVVYSDRYLTQEGAAFLAKLLRGEWLDDSSKIVIYVLQHHPSRGEDDRQICISDTVRSLLSEWTNKITIEMIPREDRDQFPHKRELTIHRQDGQVYRALFDKGLDFVAARGNDRYQIIDTTYVVVTGCTKSENLGSTPKA